MTDKQIIIDDVDVSGCRYAEPTATTPKCAINDWIHCDGHNCYYKQLKRKEQEYEELRQYHNKCCEEFEKEKKEWLEKYNQVSRGFFNGDYCNTEHCNLLKVKEQECKQLKGKLIVTLGKEGLRQSEKELKKQYNCYACDTCKGKEDYINLKRHCENAIKSLHNKHAELDQLKGEQNKIKTICDNHFDEYEMGCLDLSDAIESLLERYDNAITNLIKERKQLRTENEELKKQLTILDDEDVVVEITVKQFEEYKKLKQTLTEIKEIAENMNKECFYDDFECRDCDMKNGCTYYNKNQILQKISESEGKK